MINDGMVRHGARYWATQGTLAAAIAACALGGMFLFDSLAGWLLLLLYGAAGLGYGKGLKRAQCRQCDAQIGSSGGGR